jgi:hypothetical protein
LEIVSACGLNSIWLVFLGEEKRHKDARGKMETHGGGLANPEAGSGVQLPPAEQCLELSKAEEEEKTLPWSIWREHSPANTSVSHFSPLCQPFL